MDVLWVEPMTVYKEPWYITLGFGAVVGQRSGTRGHQAEKRGIDCILWYFTSCNATL